MNKFVLALGISAILSSGYIQKANAIPRDPIVRKTLTGAIRFVGCAPERNQVQIRVMPGSQVIQPTTSVRRPDGSVQMTFSKVVAGNQQSLRLRVLAPPACAGASVSPAERVVNDFPATVAFTVQMPTQTHRIDLGGAVNLLDLVLNSLEIKLHNYRSNDSFLKIGGMTLPFTMPPARVDLDCGTLCPDLGDALFYANDVRLNDAGLSLNGSALKLSLAFESAGREIKGLHNRLGDDAIPDFEIQNMVISSNPAFYVRPDGRMDLMFSNVKMTGSVQSTGGCSPFGIDLCNAILGTDGKVIKAVEQSTSSALNATFVRNKIADLMTSYLSSRGINGQIVYYRISGGYLEIFTR